MNKKGFTFVELLAAVVILGVISATGVVAITKIIQNGRDQHFTSSERELESIAQDYLQKNKQFLPKYVGGTTVITMQTLVKDNFMEPIKDYSGVECSQAESTVTVFKKSQSEYQYITNLVCNSQTSNVETKNHPTNLTIGNPVNYCDGTKIKYSMITLNSSQTQLLSYSYTAYAGQRSIKSSGSIALEEHPFSHVVKIEYPQTPTEVIITMIDTYGASKTVKITGSQLTSCSHHIS